MNFLYWRKISHIRHSETEASSSSRFVTPTNSSDLAHFARQLRANNQHTVSSALSLCQPTTEAAEEDYHHATRAQHSHTHSLTVEPPKMEGRKEGREGIIKLSISAFGDLSLNLVSSIRAEIGCVESKKPEVAHSIGHTWGVGCRLADLVKRSSLFNSFPKP